MYSETLPTTLDLLTASGEPIMTIKTKVTGLQTMDAAYAYLRILSDIESVRITEELPWGETIYNRVYRGLFGPDVQLEFLYGLRR